MKMIALHIDGFGKLVNYDLKFSDFTQIIEPNGWGKSTLGVFIRGMFYGIVGGNTKNGNEVILYNPWHTSAFGGTLTFEKDGETYLITRTFCEKKHCTVTKNGTAVNIGDKEPGEYFFGCSSAVFMRTVFFATNQQNNLSPDVLQEQLMAQLGGQSLSDNDTKSAIKKIEECKKSYVKKYKNSQLEKLTEKHKELTDQINDQNGIIVNREQYQKDLDDATEQYEACERKGKELDALQKRLALIQVNDQIEKAGKEIKDLDAQLQDIETKHGCLPGDAEKGKAEQLTATLTAHNIAKENAEKDFDTAEYARLQGVFARGIPDDTTCQQWRNTNGELAKSSSEIDEALPTLDVVKAVVEAWAQRKQKAFPVWTILVAVLGVVAAVVGGICQLLPVIIGGGALAVVFGLLGLVLQNKTVKKREQSVRDFLVQCGYLTVISPETALQELYQKATANAKKPNTDLSTNARQLLAQSLRVYYPDMADGIKDFTDALNRLDIDKREYKNLLEQKQKLTACTDKVDEAQKALNDYLASLGCTTQTALNELCKRVDDLRSDIQAEQKVVANLKANNPDLSAIDASTLPDEATLNQWVSENKQNKTKWQKALVTAQNNLQRVDDADESLTDLKAECDRLEAEIKTVEGKIALLDKIEERLKTAQQVMCEEAVQPLNEKLADVLAEMQLPAGSANFSLGNENNTTFLQFVVENHAFEHQSEGLKTLYALSARLAVSRTLWQGDTMPFVVLDDPFVHLDDDNLPKCQTAIKNLSQTTPILYVSCHKSREIV